MIHYSITLIKVTYREGVPISDTDAITELCSKAAAAIIMIRSNGGFDVHNTKLRKDMLVDARLALRLQMEREAQDRIRRAEGGRKISFWNFQNSISNADKLLDEGDMAERNEERERLRHMKKRQKPRHETRVHQQER